MGESDDRQLITDALIRYATGIDTKNWPLFQTCFTPDVRADYGPIGVWTDAEALTAHMARAHEKYQATNHCLSNFVITVSGDRATSSCYVQCVLALTGAVDAGLEAVGRYEDTLIRSKNDWKIVTQAFFPTRAHAYGDRPGGCST